MTHLPDLPDGLTGGGTYVLPDTSLSLHLDPNFRLKSMSPLNTSHVP